MSVRIEGPVEKGAELNVKRFYLPGVIVRSPCPKCQVSCSRHLGDNYLSYPRIGFPYNVGMYCDVCGDKFVVQIVVKITVEPA